MKDYMDLPASLSLNITGGTTGPQTSFIGKYPIGVGSIVSTDVDGDGRDELVAFNPNFNTFGIVSYFNYADLSNGANVSGWSNDTNDQLITSYLAQNELCGVPLDPSDIVGLGDFDGDGQEEIFVFSTANLNFSVFKWITSTNVLEQVYYSNTTLTGIKFNPTLQFFAADIDGDGADELMVFSQSTYWLFPVEWSSSTTNGATTFTPNMGWYPPEGVAANYPQVSTINSQSRFYVGDFDGDGAEELFVFTPGTDTYYILKWAVPAPGIPAQFNAVLSGSGTMAGVTLQDPDRFYPVDLDGDGQDELAVLYPNTSGGLSQFWIFDFTVSSPLALTPNLIWNPTVGWAATEVGINPSDQFYFGDFDGDGTQEIVMYSAADNWFFLLDWDNQTNTLSSAYASQTFIPDTVQINGALENIATNIFFSLDLDGDGTDELVLFNIMTQAIGILGTWILVAQASANLSILRYENNAFTSTWQTTTQVPSWTVDTVLSGPAVPFNSVAFTGTQLPVYQYISNLFLPQSDGDIRSYYVNLNLTSGNWSTWATLLQTMPNPQGQDFLDSDWTTVATTLVNEFSAVGPVVALTNNALGTLPIIENQQNTDLSNVLTYIGSPPSDDTTVTVTWDDAFEWLGLAAQTYAQAELPTGQGVALTVAMTVTVALLKQIGQDSTPVPVSYSSLVGALAENYVQATQSNVAIQQSVLVDAVKLPVIGQLAMGAWSWNSATIVSAITSPAVAATDRVGFYQQILPSVCQINYMSSNSNYKSGVPGWAQYVIPNDLGLYKYWVYWISFTNDEDTPPNQLCLSDLFYTCGVSQADFFLGVGPWANIPHVYPD